MPNINFQYFEIQDLHASLMIENSRLGNSRCGLPNIENSKLEIQDLACQILKLANY